MTDLTLNVPHGYRLTPGTDLLDLAARLREAMEPIRDRIEIEQVAEFAAKALDAADLAGTPRPESVIFDAVQAQTVHVGQILSGEHSCALNTVKIAVTDDPETGEMYALMFPKQQAFAQELDEMELGDYYPYWNEEETEAPRPTGVSAAEWARRAATWTRVLRGTNPLDPTGMFIIEIGAAYPDADLINRAADVLAAMPTKEQRVFHAMHELQHNQEFSSQGELMAFVATLPEHQERIQSSLKPITLADIAGGAR
ncbi:hypothetical protein Achl_4121 (plasmid) [Pseudarthrobacter chlorophenolicus A6]|uniref:Uncharacterized protein n=1 Tax=Pseudarthrobacter chlorophenolicus (strain ATCC 700700 / DSM 12829 / CIP 107037 / JCM 12360 / KCTC 9906 / NCIMB 13794 / A6) TaxID=452863 RepID=B8HI25_PSECP|nr:hypothetical protein [Pseudarthrobacter chlorophenolicus]ACL42072.1 hypothetical protein Achl_4121 [Pseudarthrobacter chlorophenolicus A6]SDQ13041.1 hypothetical protein SAMN04489738_0180 [Pseudarthrobacter chlorophenolicus]SDQ21189.1 hypothetical protein SAMN04489738_0771 [Pseudarthrobacter chlorophenolicus]